MSAEYLTAFASIGTFVVIAVTALAAVVQLRHIRSANQLTGLLHFTAWWEGDAIQSATKFVEAELPAKLQDPAYVRGLCTANPDRRDHPELVVCDFLEQTGSYIKYGMIEKNQFLDLVSAYIDSMWSALGEVVAIRRVARDDGGMYLNFEYDDYPRGVRRLMPEEAWRALGRR